MAIPDQLTEAEWRSVLHNRPFGHVVTNGDDGWPVVVPVHFTYDGDRTVSCLVPASNDVIGALREQPRCALTVVADVAFIPSTWNLGLPATYYTMVQVCGEASIVDQTGRLRDVVATHLEHLERPTLGAEDRPSRRLHAVCGLSLDIREVRATAHYGVDRSPVQRAHIADLLAERGSPQDLAARRWLLRPAPLGS